MCAVFPPHFLSRSHQPQHGLWPRGPPRELTPRSLHLSWPGTQVSSIFTTHQRAGSVSIKMGGKESQQPPWRTGTQPFPWLLALSPGSGTLIGASLHQKNLVTGPAGLPKGPVHLMRLEVFRDQVKVWILHRTAFNKQGCSPCSRQTPCQGLGAAMVGPGTPSPPFHILQVRETGRHLSKATVPCHLLASGNVGTHKPSTDWCCFRPSRASVGGSHQPESTRGFHRRGPCPPPLNLEPQLVLVLGQVG